MCGLIGMIAKTHQGFWGVDKEIFTQMLYADAVRGKDATGVFGVNKHGNVHWLKQASASGWFVTTKDYDEFATKIPSEMMMVIGHNRKATHGDKKNEDAHPFIKDHITLVHNGMIRNHKELCKESTVDSNAVANALAATNDTVEVLSKAEGAFAFIWYNAQNKTLYFVRNKERPLSIIETDKCWYLASEFLLAGWCISRNNQTVKNKIDCEEHTLYSINLDKKELVEEKLTLKKSQPTYPKNNEDFYGGLWGNDDKTATLFIDKSIIESQPIIWAEKGQQVLAEVTDYSDYNAPNYNKDTVSLTCKLLNCDLKGPIVHASVPLNEIEKVLESCVITGYIRTIGYHPTKELWLSGVAATTVIESANHVMVAEEMWYDLEFPSTCDTCKKAIQFENLDTVVVDMKYHWQTGAKVICTCKECTDKEDLCSLASC